MQTALAATLGDAANVKARVYRVEIDVKNLDESTTKNDVLKAQFERFEENREILGIDAVKFLKKTYGGTQIAVVNLPQLARKVLGLGKICVGWVICRVRKRRQPIKCYRCWQYEHLAQNCKSTCDIADCCITCGTRGHHAKVCENKPKSPLLGPGKWQ